MNKFGIDSLKEKTLIGKIFDHNFLKNDANLKRLSRKFNNDRRSRACKTEQTNDETLSLKKDENQTIFKDVNEHMDDNKNNGCFEVVFIYLI